MTCIELLEQEHVNINRMLKVIEEMCCGILEGAEIEESDHRMMIDYARNYADKHHHGKEEKILFPEMVKISPLANNLITHGMLVEHSMGRAHVLKWEMALNSYLKEPKTIYKLSVLTEAMSYVDQLREHTAREDNAVYPLAVREFDQNKMTEIERRIFQFEEEQAKAGFHEKYDQILSAMEQKYLK